MKAGGEAQGIQGLSENCTSRKSVSPLLRLIRDFHSKFRFFIPPWEDQCEWHIMARMTGPDCAIMRNLINTHTHGNENEGGGERRNTKWERGRERGRGEDENGDGGGDQRANSGWERERGRKREE